MNKSTILVLIFIISKSFLVGQTKNELEKSRNRLQEEINQANELLKNISQKKDRSLEALIILRQRIDLRQENISQIKKEISLLDNQIEYLRLNIDENEILIGTIRKSYEKDILIAFKMKNSYYKSMYIYGSENLNVALRRIKFLSEIAKSRKEKARKIERIKEDLSFKLNQVVALKDEKNRLLIMLDYEIKNLTKDLRQQEKEIEDLKKREIELKKKLEEKKKAAIQLEKKIRDLIEKETKVTKNGAYYEMTPEEKELSRNFDSNKGKLPWPTERGMITEQFGIHNHPILKNIQTRNDGVDITTTPNSYVRSVFDGTVKNIFVIPGLNKVVIIRHGKFLTVYSNLEEVYVKQGQNVQTKERIGKLFYDQKSDFSILKFQIWHENQKLNPEEWITRLK